MNRLQRAAPIDHAARLEFGAGQGARRDNLYSRPQFALADYFGFEARDYARIRALHVGAPAEDEDSHAVLGVEPGASPDEIRAAYHRLVRDNHPDLLVSQGLPPEFVALATARVARINAAHDRLTRRHAGIHPPPG